MAPCSLHSLVLPKEVLIYRFFAREAAEVVQGCTGYGAEDAKDAKKNPRDQTGKTSRISRLRVRYVFQDLFRGAI
jgi:hypothetical protein